MLIIALLVTALAVLAIGAGERERKRSEIGGCRNVALWAAAIGVWLVLLAAASIATGAGELFGP